MMSHRWHPTGPASVAVLVVVTACASPAASVDPSPSEPAEPATPDACRPIDLRAPSGERVDLTGTWQETGGGPFYIVDQNADCVWIIGAFLRHEDVEGFAMWETFVFDGNLRPDFTLQGRSVFLNLPGQTRDYSGTFAMTLDLGGDPWALQGPPYDTLSGPAFLRLERVTDRWVAP
jgi:hypothetical protein